MNFSKALLFSLFLAPIIWDDRIYLTTVVSPTEAELKIGLYGDISSANDAGIPKAINKSPSMNSAIVLSPPPRSPMAPSIYALSSPSSRWGNSDLF